MELFILTCTDWRSRVLMIHPYETLADARFAMEQDINGEKQNSLNEGGTVSAEVNRQTAELRNSKGDIIFRYEINAVDYNPTGTDKYKDRMDELTHTIFEQVEDGAVYDLTEPVGDYNGFYCDFERGTLMVWNNKKKRYLNIININAEAGYEIASQLLNGDYEKN